MATFIKLDVKVTSVSILQGQGLMVTGNDDKTVRVSERVLCTKLC